VRGHLIQSSAGTDTCDTNTALLHNHHALGHVTTRNDSYVHSLVPDARSRLIRLLYRSLRVSVLDPVHRHFLVSVNHIAVSRTGVRRVCGCGCYSIVVVRIYKSPRLYHTNLSSMVFPLAYEYTFTRTLLVALGPVRVYARVARPSGSFTRRSCYTSFAL
jgi:hypothetical protein